MDFMRNLRARLIDEPLVWKFVYELTWLNGTDKDPFKDVTSDEPVTMEDIRTVREHLNDEMTYADCMAEMTEPAAGSDAERGRWLAAENAVFNLLGALSAAEKACAEDGEETDSVHKYPNITRLLRRGYYHGIYLEGADFADCNLRRADLTEARMADACLTSANLKGTSLAKADLAGADMRGANLIDANLSGAALARGNFLRADLTEANLDGADLRNASFDGTAACESETEQESESPTGRENTSLTGARLSHAKMGGAHLEKVYLKGASLADADLVGAFLAGADLRDADLTDARLPRADLAGADLRGAWVIGADLSGARLEGAYLDGAVLKGALLPDARLERAHLVGAELSEADLNGAHFEGASLNAAYLGTVVPDCPESFDDDLSRPAVLSDASFAGADINGAYLSDSQYRYVVETGAVGQPLRLFGGGIQLAGSITGRMGEKDRGSQKALSLGSGMGQIAFGRYRQGKNGEVLPLRWRVLKTDPAENKVLLITEKLIDCRSYHERWTDITWEECDLRGWLNEDFFREAFNEDERKRIAITPNLNPDNRRYRIRGGNPTDDKVFLLGIEEVEFLFHSDRDRTADITPYAKEQYRRNGYGSDPSGRWWLRSPGSLSRDAVCVAPGGGVLDGGLFVFYDDVFVRPALWLNL